MVQYSLHLQCVVVYSSKLSLNLPCLTILYSLCLKLCKNILILWDGGSSIYHAYLVLTPSRISCLRFV
uniref:Uncharacterized protein n=1 Tax=Aegilops tauschii subsp. strangulata TaxID=200361 RepID=A0A453CKC6_AEGTS